MLPPGSVKLLHSIVNTVSLFIPVNGLIVHDPPIGISFKPIIIDAFPKPIPS